MATQIVSFLVVQPHRRSGKIVTSLAITGARSVIGGVALAIYIVSLYIEETSTSGDQPEDEVVEDDSEPMNPGQGAQEHNDGHNGLDDVLQKLYSFLE